MQHSHHYLAQDLRPCADDELQDSVRLLFQEVRCACVMGTLCNTFLSDTQAALEEKNKKDNDLAPVESPLTYLAQDLWPCADDELQDSVRLLFQEVQSTCVMGEFI